MTQAARKRVILIVDDVPANIDVLAGILKGDYRLKVATSGRKAIEIAASQDPPDLVLLDVMMPDVSGFDVARALKASPQTQRIPIVMVTALTEVDQRVKGLECGADEFMSKPVDDAEVRARVRSLLKVKAYNDLLHDQQQELETKVKERTEQLEQADRDLKEALLATVNLAYDLMSLHDGYLGDHSKRVANYAKAIIAELGGTDEGSAFECFLAGLLHDVGLVGIPGDKVRKFFFAMSDEHALSADYRAHPVTELASFGPSRQLAKVSLIIAAHHENLDGTGFPHGLRGDAIPRESQIIAAADRYDIFSRMVKPSLSVDQALERLRRSAAGKIHQDILGALERTLRTNDPFSKVVAAGVAGLNPGAVLAKPARSISGAILLVAGLKLTDAQIALLQKWADMEKLELPIHVYREG